MALANDPETGLTASEMLAVVDEENNVVGEERRAVVRGQQLRHRATYIFAHNSQGQFYVQRRTMIKDYCPGFLDPVSGGCVGAGESYADNARREIEEELGIVPDAAHPLEHLFTFYFEDETSKCWGDAWEIEYDGELTLQPEEVDEVLLMTMDEIQAAARDGTHQFTPDGMAAVERYLAHKAAVAVAASE